MKSAKTVIVALAVLACLGAGLPAFAGGGKEAGEILIGAPLPLTGPYASDGEQMRMALELAVEETNAGGGLLGKTIRLITGDVGALEAEKIKAVGERLAGAGVHAVITGYADSGVDARVFSQYPMPFLHADAMTLSAEVAVRQIEETGTSNVFQYCPPEVAYGVDANENLFKIPAAMGWTPPTRKIAIVKVDYSYNILAADTLRDLAVQKGYEVVVDETIQFGHVEFGPILSKIASSGASYVTFWDLDPGDAANFIKQFYDRFIDRGIQAIVYMQYTPVIPEFLSLAGDAAQGLIWSVTVAPVNNVEEYDKRWIARFGTAPASSYSYGTRDGFEIWASAVRSAGSYDDYPKIVEALGKTDYVGLTGRIRFDPKNHNAYAGVDGVPTLWHQVWGGKHHVTYPQQYNKEGYRYQRPPWLK